MSTKETAKSVKVEKISLDVRVCVEERTEGKIERERRALKSQRAGMDPVAPGQQHLSSWEMQQTTADGCSLAYGSSDL